MGKMMGVSHFNSCRWATSKQPCSFGLPPVRALLADLRRSLIGRRIALSFVPRPRETPIADAPLHPDGCHVVSLLEIA